jgi:FtsZ-binding cell division protein ZapB
MNQETAVLDDTGFEVLEDKVNRAVEMIRRLKDEKKLLIESRAELEARLAEAAAVPPGVVEELTNRVAQLEKERAAWQGEKRELTRRVEGILAKLELLESESVSH